MIMNSKRLIISAFGLMMSLSGFSNQSKPAEVRGAKFIAEASRAIKANDSYRINFTLEIENPSLKNKDTSRGLLIISGNRYYMEAAGNVFVSDGTTTWAYFKDNNEVHIDLVANNPEDPTPTSILGDFEKKFRAKHIKQETHKGRRVEVIDLLPKTAYIFHKVRIGMDSKTKMLVYTIAYDREGGSTRFEFDTLEANPTISHDRFRFNPNSYPGIEVVDLR